MYLFLAGMCMCKVGAHTPFDPFLKKSRALAGNLCIIILLYSVLRYHNIIQHPKSYYIISGLLGDVDSG